MPSIASDTARVVGYAGRPLEGDVLHEMRRARLFGRLEARSGQDVGGDGDGARSGEGDVMTRGPPGSAVRSYIGPMLAEREARPNAGRKGYRRNEAAGALRAPAA
jgi:hypothetical protein